MLTGIIWLGVRDSIDKRDWSGALEYANTLSATSDSCPALTDDSVAGDWRLPNIKELYSLVDITADTALLPPGLPLSGDWVDVPFEILVVIKFSTCSRDDCWAVEANFGRPTIFEKQNVCFVWSIRVGK